MTSGWSDVVERDDAMDDGNYHTREVYAHFGLAVYQAQVLEHGVVNLLTLAKIFPDPAATREMHLPLGKGKPTPSQSVPKSGEKTGEPSEPNGAASGSG